ncbi:mitogen-activated protein kinase kinase kinase 1-like isoform X2 [Hydractinia symbiolongicarpus]|uniref:mitogen-activated protein kinase kinase kinase 1-like isoform X2 n=1 Tax=Hydractinia symbiolongicarpus TaxID=13093 RepID=UPI00254D7A1D|nr:mitogen-activated protein kinase kinase kinase 1-like isoform X2 [Hydractinia symbiolongicarpus]
MNVNKYYQVERPSSRRRSPSPRSFFKRPPSPSIDPHVEADMNRVKKQVPKVLKARLYLLQQPGPNSFLIGGDSPDHKYKVIIGPQTCTCGKDPFCIHVLFVMLRVFKVKETEILLWTRELKNFEVESLFRRYHKRIELLSKQNVTGINSKLKVPMMHGALPNPLVAGGHSSHSNSLGKEEEEVCPICLSDLVEGESMTLCREGCQNRLHHHCMAVWAEECRRRKEALNCPLCRTVWQSRRSASPVKMGQNLPSGNNPLNIQAEDAGIPHGEIIPEEFVNLANPWVQVFGNDAVACLFSRDWKHRESGLRFISRKAVKILTEKKTTNTYFDTKWELLGVCSCILKHIMADPVYNVYVAALRAFRAIISHVKYRSNDEISQFHRTIKPVIEKILLKCTDANRRVTIISNKVLMEFVHVEQAAHAESPAFVEQYMILILSCLEDSDGHDYTQWQWWLGRLIFIRRLFDEHNSLLLNTETRENINFLSLPVSQSSEIDLREFLNSLEENIHSSTTFNDTTSKRLKLLVQFSADAVSSPHKKVHKCALSLLVKFIAVSAQDSRLFTKIKEIVQRLKPTVQSTLHRHLSFEAQREQADILNILDEHGDLDSHRSVERDLNNSSEREEEDEQAGAAAAPSSILTPPGSPHPRKLSPPRSAYDPRLKCVQQIEDDEAAALAIALGKSLRPENVVPEQLIPTDDLTLVHIQPGGKEEEICHSKNVYLENVHWKKGGLLGTGAFSSCFEAMDFKSGRIMAVKQISFCRNTEEEQIKVHEVVLEEIALMHRLKHPHIVACLGATQHNGHYNLFLELMAGGSISSLLSRFGAFRETVVLSYTKQIIQAVAYLHQNHTLHRDLKGANILVDSTGQIVKLSDFGTAARLMAHGTGTKEFCGQLLGTIPFMSPEVLRGEHYGRKCDIWSVGCCIIEMASATLPWGAQQMDNHLALMFKIASASSAPLIPARLGPGLRDVTLRCLELKETERPTADELLRHAVFRV